MSNTKASPAQPQIATTSLDYLIRGPIETLFQLTCAVLVQAYDLVPEGACADSHYEAADRHVDAFVALLVAMNILPGSEERRTAEALAAALHWLTCEPEKDIAEHFVGVAYPAGLEDTPAPRELVALYAPRRQSCAADPVVHS